MTISTATRQYGSYLIMVVCTGISTVYLYNWVNYDWILFRQGEKKYQAQDYAEAARLFEKAQKHGFHARNIDVNLANAFVAVGQFDRAIELYRAHLAEEPADEKTRLELAKVLSWTGKEAEAELEYKIILEDKDEN